MDRQEWFPLDEIIDELKDKLATRPDWITMSGSGEPTLYSRLGELIARIHSITDVPVAVLTNGSLLWHEDVQREIMDANLVIPSLDAGDQSMFTAVNRPHPSISFDFMVDGLATFRDRYRGQYWLEVFILGGHTAVRAETGKITSCVRRRIRPDRIQLNTVTRPPAEDYAAPVDRHLLENSELFTRAGLSRLPGAHGAPEFGDQGHGAGPACDAAPLRHCRRAGIHRNEAEVAWRTCWERCSDRVNLKGTTCSCRQWLKMKRVLPVAAPVFLSVIRSLSVLQHSCRRRAHGLTPYLAPLACISVMSWAQSWRRCSRAGGPARWRRR